MVKGEPTTRLSFERIGADLTPYSFLHIFPQDEHERLLIERLQALGVSVEHLTELVSFTEKGGRVIAQLRGPEGRVFRRLLDGPYGAGHDNDRLRHFIYYIDRHIELDGDNHGPKEREPLEDLLRTRRIGRSGPGAPHTATLKPELGFGTAH